MADGGDKLVLQSLDFLALGGVARDRDECAGVAGPAYQLHGDVHRDHLSVGAAMHGFDLARLDFAAQEGLDRFVIVRHGNVAAKFPWRHPEQFFLRIAKRLDRAVVDVCETQGVRIVDEDHVQRVVHDILEAVQRFADARAFVHIARCGDDLQVRTRIGATRGMEGGFDPHPAPGGAPQTAGEYARMVFFNIGKDLLHAWHVIRMHEVQDLHADNFLR